jgi:hypothetical protein
VTEHERLAEHIDQMSPIGVIDPDAEVFGRLAELRSAIASGIGSATRDFDAVRAAWTAVFASTWIMPDGNEGYGVVPVLRPEMAEGGWDADDGYPTGPPHRRASLPLDANSTGTHVLDQIRTRAA